MGPLGVVECAGTVEELIKIIPDCDYQFLAIHNAFPEKSKARQAVQSYLKLSCTLDDPRLEVFRIERAWMAGESEWILEAE